MICITTFAKSLILAYLYSIFNIGFIYLEVGPSSPTCLASQTLRKYGENRFAPTSTL